MIDRVVMAFGVLFILAGVWLYARGGDKRSTAELVTLVLLGAALTQAPRLKSVLGAEFYESARGELEATQAIREMVEQQASIATEARERAEQAAKAIDEIQERANLALERAEQTYNYTEELTRRLDDQVEYHDVATVDIYGMRDGRRTDYTWGVNADDTFLGIFQATADEVTGRCDDQALTLYHEQIEKKWELPFPHLLLATCLKQAGDVSWRDEAQTADSIFIRTLRVPGRHEHHVIGARQARQLLRTE